MTKKEVKSYFEAFMIILTKELMSTIDDSDGKIYENRLKGELFEAFLQTLTAGLEFLRNMPTQGKENFIILAEEIRKELQNGDNN